ncbi:helix-turn-helix domain-containing protein [Nonomuraea sp. NBC_00507]|uniref:helix-turn-helix domain-containing protein n=1 Tax=Nonomuraea sp. NBC_00507 TaxID=2976002 RepID=UPI002E16BB77
MPSASRSGIGWRIAYYRSVARLTQQQLADAANIHVGTLRKIERGARGASDSIREAIAAALSIDHSLLLADRAQASSRIRAALPALSTAIADYDVPDDGPVRALPELQQAVSEAVAWRLAAQYVQITRRLPDLLSELFRALQAAPPGQEPDLARARSRRHCAVPTRSRTSSAPMTSRPASSN